jgi:hypothetical protein
MGFVDVNFKCEFYTLNQTGEVAKNETSYQQESNLPLFSLPWALENIHIPLQTTAVWLSRIMKTGEEAKRTETIQQHFRINESIFHLYFKITAKTRLGP